MIVLALIFALFADEIWNREIDHIDSFNPCDFSNYQDACKDHVHIIDMYEVYTEMETDSSIYSDVSIMVYVAGIDTIKYYNTNLAGIDTTGLRAEIKRKQQRFRP